METLFLTPDAKKYVEQAERKREYNRRYYHEKVKPKRESQKQELERLRLENEDLRERVYYYDQNAGQPEELQNQLYRAVEQIRNLHLQIEQLEKDNSNLHQNLELARQRNYELLRSNADDFLPSLSNLTLNSGESN